MAEEHLGWIITELGTKIGENQWAAQKFREVGARALANECDAVISAYSWCRHQLQSLQQPSNLKSETTMKLERAWAIIRRRVEAEINNSSSATIEQQKEDKELADACVSIAEQVVSALITLAKK